MAKISENGLLSGVCGPVVFATWKGKPYCRSKPGPRKYKTSQKQLIQQRRFTAAREFVDSFKGLMKFSFTTNLEKKTPRNSAIGFLAKHALQGDYPNFSINYSKALVTEGIWENVVAPKVMSKQKDHIHFSWTDNAHLIKGYRTEQVMLIAYCPELNYGIFKITEATRRTAAAAMLVEDFAGLTVHTWIAVRSMDGKRISNSVYTGEIVVPDNDIIQSPKTETLKVAKDRLQSTMVVTAVGNLLSQHNVAISDNPGDDQYSQKLIDDVLGSDQDTRNPG